MRRLLVVLVLLLTCAAAPLRAHADDRTILRLTLQDSGGTFSVEPETLIELDVPFRPGQSLFYNRSILRPAGEWDNLLDHTPPYQLVAVASGITPLNLVQRPICPPGAMCPMYMALTFHATIIVTGEPEPVTPLPPVPSFPVTSDVYIGTASLGQTVRVQPGQAITLELPYLSAQQPIQLQFDPAVLTLISGQPSPYPPGGWRFEAAQSGTTSITVGSANANGPNGLYFRVQIVVGSGAGSDSESNSGSTN